MRLPNIVYDGAHGALVELNGKCHEHNDDTDIAHYTDLSAGGYDTSKQKSGDGQY